MAPPVDELSSAVRKSATWRNAVDPRSGGGGCRSESECSQEDFCLDLIPNQVTGSCRPRMELGAACSTAPWDSRGGCAQGSWCLDGSCAVPAIGSLAVGAECSNQVQCVEGAVCERLRPFQFGRCASPRVNGPCLEGFCPADSRCMSVSGSASCLPLGGLHDPCTVADRRWDNCKIGLACEDVGEGVLRCEVLRANGRACLRDEQCLSGGCLEGLCAALGGLDASCRADAHCLSNACSPEGRCLASCF